MQVCHYRQLSAACVELLSVWVNGMTSCGELVWKISYQVWVLECACFSNCVVQAELGLDTSKVGKKPPRLTELVLCEMRLQWVSFHPRQWFSVRLDATVLLAAVFQKGTFKVHAICSLTKWVGTKTQSPEQSAVFSEVACSPHEPALLGVGMVAHRLPNL